MTYLPWVGRLARSRSYGSFADRGDLEPASVHRAIDGTTWRLPEWMKHREIEFHDLARHGRDHLPGGTFRP
jgi:hypothetical protein